LINKLNSIGYYNHYYYIFGGADYLEVYTGKCHGDMTLSNMIFKDDDVYLIDFLDSYIESPTMDLIKLRQDTHLHWSFNMIDVKKSDLMKSKIALEYIDNWITDTYDMTNYKILQIINLVRIFPYATDIKIKNFIHEKIKLIWNQ
jgi:thiamine kinase-like enzyme